MGGAVVVTPDDAARLPFRPCVGIVLANRRGLVFAGERIDTPGAWQMPQGGIDAGEAPRDAALREVREELGLAPAAVEIKAEIPDWIAYDLPLDLVGRLWGGRYRGQQQKWFLMRLKHDEKFDLEGHEPEFRSWRWLEPDDLLAAIVPFKREVYATVFARFASHLAHQTRGHSIGGTDLT
jgi:putative (di)nucleoside polyphosphate hydrolase